MTLVDFETAPSTHFFPPPPPHALGLALALISTSTKNLNRMFPSSTLKGQNVGKLPFHTLFHRFMCNPREGLNGDGPVTFGEAREGVGKGLSRPVLHRGASRDLIRSPKPEDAYVTSPAVPCRWVEPCTTTSVGSTGCPRTFTRHTPEAEGFPPWRSSRSSGASNLKLVQSASGSRVGLLFLHCVSMDKVTPGKPVDGVTPGEPVGSKC